jgi:hypothetical protein
MFEKEFYNGIPNVTNTVNVFVTLAIQQHLEYHCKALFETFCTTVGHPGHGMWQ